MMKAEPAGSNQETLGETELVKWMWAQDRLVLSTKEKELERKAQDSEEREREMRERQIPQTRYGRGISLEHLTTFNCRQKFMQAVVSVKQMSVKSHIKTPTFY